MKIGFYTEGEETEGMDFGCLTQGFPQTETGVQMFELDQEGRICYGSYAEVTAFCMEYQPKAAVAILLTDGAGKENELVKNISGILHCPVVGGGAARNAGNVGEGLFWKKGKAAICILEGTDNCFHVDVLNIHQHILEECTLELKDSRTVSKINGMDAAWYLRRKKELHGYDPSDFERITLSTYNHVNAHLSEVNGVIRSGRDLEKHMLLRCVMPGRVQPLVEEFYREKENAVVFGCAGLKGILEKPFSCRALGTFLYGEICCLNGKSDFGNLMLSRISTTEVL